MSFGVTVTFLSIGDSHLGFMEITQSSPSLRILTVDDEPAVLEVLSLFLGEDGHQVEAAQGGEEGWNRFQSGTWDVVLTDRVMSGMTGDQLVSQIRQVAPDMPVVMVTGIIDPNAAGEMERAGADVIIRKPFTLTSLRKGITAALERHLSGQHAA